MMQITEFHSNCNIDDMGG